MNFEQECLAIRRMDQLIRNQQTMRCMTFKFKFNMADKGSEGAGRHVAGGDAGDGPVRGGAVAVDGDVNGCVSRPPFLIGVAGGTASGKVWMPIRF